MFNEESPRQVYRRKVLFARTLRKEMTPAEAVLWKALRNRRLKHLKFRRQVPLDLYIVDFLCMRHNLVVEVDGSIHEKMEKYDREREAYLKHRGLKVLRFTNTDVLKRLPSVLQAIEDAVHRKVSSPSPDRLSPEER